MYTLSFESVMMWIVDKCFIFWQQRWLFICSATGDPKTSL